MNINATLIAQIINFLVLVFIMVKFAYKPLLEILEKRKNKIASDLESAEQDKLMAAKLKQEYETQLAEARSQAQAIVDKANKLAEQTKEEMIQQARQEHERLLKAAQDQIEREREKVVKELRSEVVTLSMLAATKIIGENMDSKANAKVVNDFIDKLDEEKIGDLPC